MADDHRRHSRRPAGARPRTDERPADACTATRSPPCCAPGRARRRSTPTAQHRWRRTPKPPSRCTPATGCTTAARHRWAGCPRSRTCTRRPLTAEPGETVRLRLTVASDCSDATLHGGVRLRYPQGWGATDDTATRMWAPRSNGLAVELEPRGHTDTDITIAIPPDAAPGLYPVRAQLRLGGKMPAVLAADRRGRLRHHRRATRADAQLIRLTAEPADIVVARGGTARLSVTVATDARADLALEAHLISPWGTWEWIGPASCGAVLPRRLDGRGGLRRHPAAVADPRQVVGADPDRLRGQAALHPGGRGDGPMSVAATVAGAPVRGRRDRRPRGRCCAPRPQTAALPRPGHQRGPATAPLAHPVGGHRTRGGR